MFGVFPVRPCPISGLLARARSKLLGIPLAMLKSYMWQESYLPVRELLEGEIFS
jgi:hypothetical protein